MLPVASAAVRENDAPLVKGREPRKFTPENIARIKDWVAQGVGRDEIANRLEVTVGSLQVTCSRLGISLRKRASANGNGAIKPLRVVQSSIMEDIQQCNTPAPVRFTLLIKTRNRQAAFDLPLHQGLIEQLALEATVRGQSVADLIRKIVRQVLEKDLVGELLRNGNSSFGSPAGSGATTQPDTSSPHDGATARRGH
jgi:hypothetical protein